MLSTSRQALDQQSLARILDLYQALLRAVPYSPHTTLPEGDGNALIAYVKSLDLLAEQKDALGNILYLDEQNAVLMTYYRNNVMHIFALPALLASFFQSSSRISREQIQRFTEALYPYLRAELFMRWEVEELEAVVDQWLAAFVEHGLLKVDGNHYVRPAPSSRQFVLLLARVVMQTLQRFYMATSLLLNSGQHSLSAEELENLCTVMAQRLSILHGLNAPEFFDKTLFRHFIQSMQEQGVVSTDANGRLGYHESSRSWPREPPSACYRRRFGCRSGRSHWSAITTTARRRRRRPTPDAARSSGVPGGRCVRPVARLRPGSRDDDRRRCWRCWRRRRSGSAARAGAGVLEQGRADACALLRWCHEDRRQDVIEQRHEADQRAIPLVDPGLRSGQIEVAHVSQPRLPETARDEIMGPAGRLEPDAQQRFQVIGAVGVDHVKRLQNCGARR